MATTDMTPKLEIDPNTGRILLGGRVYEHLDHRFSVSDHIACIEALTNERDGRAHLHHQPWEQIRKIYRDEGDGDAVRQINMAYDTAKARFDFETARGLWAQPVSGDPVDGGLHDAVLAVVGICLLPWLDRADVVAHLHERMLSRTQSDRGLPGLGKP